MPTIRRFSLQEERTGVPGAISTRPIASAGTQIAGGLSKGLGDLGAGLEINAEHVATTEAESALVEFERRKNDLFFNPDSGYFNTSGRDAYDGAAGVSESLSKLQKEFEGRLGARAREKFSKIANNHVTRGVADINRHASSGFKAWEGATVNATIENQVENAHLYFNDPKRLDTERLRGEAAVVEANRLSGLGAQDLAEKLQSFRSAFATAAITAAQAHSAQQGKQLLEELGPSGKKWLEGDDLTRLTKQVKIQTDADTAITLGRQALSGVDVSLSDALAKASALTQGMDATLIKAVEDEVIRGHRIIAAANAELQTEALDLFEAEGLTGAQARAKYPQKFATLTPAQQTVVDTGAYQRTVAQTFHTFNAMTDDELLTYATDDRFADEYSEKLTELAPDDRSALIRRVTDLVSKGVSEDDQRQVGQTRSAQIKQAVRTVLDAESLTKDADIEYVNALYESMDIAVKQAESIKKDDLTSEEFTDVINGFIGEVVVNNGFLGMFDVKRTIETIPADKIVEYTKILRDNHKAVTAESLMFLHNRRND